MNTTLYDHTTTGKLKHAVTSLGDGTENSSEKIRLWLFPIANSSDQNSNQ